MSVTIKGNKRVKREIVVPFEGEEMFVVPKRKGFGQPDMEGYVMAVGTTSSTLEGSTLGSPTPTTTTSSPTLSSSTLGSSTLGDGSAIPPPSGTTSSPTPLDPTGTLGGSYSGTAVGSGTNAGDTPVGTQTQAGTTTILQPTTAPEMGSNTPTSTPNTITYGTGLIDLPSGGTGTNTGVVYDQQGNVILSTISTVPVTTADTPTGGTGGTGGAGGTETQPPLEVPTFPDASSMNCTDLTSEIARLNSIIATSRFPIAVANAYNNQLSLVKSLHSTKCTKTPIDDKLILTPINPISGIGGGGGGIFGGGGGGIAPEEGGVQEVAPDESGKRIGLFLVLAVIGGLYYLTRKRQ